MMIYVSSTVLCVVMQASSLSLLFLLFWFVSSCQKLICSLQAIPINHNVIINIVAGHMFFSCRLLYFTLIGLFNSLYVFLTVIGCTLISGWVNHIILYSHKQFDFQIYLFFIFAI